MLFLWLAGVEINHILYLGAAPVNDPVVAVKGRRVAEQRVEAGLGGHFGREAGEGVEARTAGATNYGEAKEVRVSKLAKKKKDELVGTATKQRKGDCVVKGGIDQEKPKTETYLFPS